MSNIVEYPFINILDDKIDIVTQEMLLAICAAQPNQDFFYHLVNKASHLFQHRQIIEMPLWYDFIKVYVGVPVSKTFIMAIDDSDRLDEDIVAVPFGLISELAAISNVKIPVSIPLDQALVLGGDTKRGLMYQWMHTDTDTLMLELSRVWHSVITRNPAKPISTVHVEGIIASPHEHTALLSEGIALRLHENSQDQKRRLLLESALFLTKMYAENEDDVCQVLIDEDCQESSSDISEYFQNLDLEGLYDWMQQEIGYVSLFGEWNNFLKYCKDMLDDEKFIREEQELYLWLHSLILVLNARELEEE